LYIKFSWIGVCVIYIDIVCKYAKKETRTMTQVYKLESHQISFCTKCILGNKIDRKFFPAQADQQAIPQCCSLIKLRPAKI
jgi:hypothetical protein